MLLPEVKKCKILQEFSPSEQLEFFGIKSKKTLHHIDTLYYSVFLNEDPDIVKLQRDNNIPDNLRYFLSVLYEAKKNCREFIGAENRFGDLTYTLKSFSIYEFCVSLPECFDIFVSNYIPTAETPRIVVQLRSRYLVLEGIKKAIEESLHYLREFLKPFGLFPMKVRENRIDYAFHTNLIQNPDTYFDDNKLRKHLKTNLRTFSKYGSTKEFKVDTLNLGRRSSNSIFFRAYNKGREVIEMNYKSFFIERWAHEGLISQFDKYVYETAYNLRSFRSGILVGRLQWYIEYGRDDDLRDFCFDLLKSDYINSDNNDDIEKRIKNIIPEPTVIFNVEYQCKRKFFFTCENWIGYKLEVMNFVKAPDFCDPLLCNLLAIVYSSPEIVDYLTGFGNVVSFVHDRNISLKEFIKRDKPYLQWWKLLRSANIDYVSDSEFIEFYRTYDVNASFERTCRMFESNVAKLSMFLNNTTDEQSFVEDISDVLCIFNDNDAYRYEFKLDFSKLIPDMQNHPRDLAAFNPFGYRQLRARRGRQIRGVLKKRNNDNKQNDKTPEGEV